MEDLERLREHASALKRFHTLELRSCFDPIKPLSRATKTQDLVLRETKDYLMQAIQGGNQSGKTQTGARIVSWLFENVHPYWDTKALWVDEPLLIIIVGRINNQVEEIWDRKIKPYLTPGTYRENRQGGTLQYVINTSNGNKIIFASHANPSEAKEKLQSYSAHFVWLDELTDHLGVIEELQRRVQAKRGRMLITFTPKIRAEAVRKWLDTPVPSHKIYRISMLDNPIYDERRDELMSQILAMPKSQQDTILYGEWYVGEQSVFSFDPAKHMENPPGYSVLWPHVVSVDPAASGLMGFSVWAAPYDHAPRWWCVASDYLKGAAPSDLVDLCEDKVRGLNVIWRVSDSHEAWFIKQASKVKVTYRGIPNKHGRKKDLIAQVNQALASGRIRLTTVAQELAAELSTAQWHETNEDKIINASSFHLADTCQYFVDQMPTIKSNETVNLSFDAQLKLANQQRIKAEQERASGKKQSWRILARKGRTWKRSA